MKVIKTTIKILFVALLAAFVMVSCTKLDDMTDGKRNHEPEIHACG
jgi:hypothetical protein